MNGHVAGFPGLIVGKNIFDGAIALCAIPKGGNEEVLVVAFVIGIHDRVSLPAADWTGRMNEVHFLHVLREIGKRLAKFVCRNS
jgi:hypothetical protein